MCVAGTQCPSPDSRLCWGREESRQPGESGVPSPQLCQGMECAALGVETDPAKEGQWGCWELAELGAAPQGCLCSPAGWAHFIGGRGGQAPSVSSVAQTLLELVGARQNSGESDSIAMFSQSFFMRHLQVPGAQFDSLARWPGAGYLTSPGLHLSIG